jgi:hypothetical protein
VMQESASFKVRAAANQALQRTPPHRLFPGFSSPVAGPLSWVVRPAVDLSRDFDVSWGSGRLQS